MDHALFTSVRRRALKCPELNFNEQQLNLATSFSPLNYNKYNTCYCIIAFMDSQVNDISKEDICSVSHSHFCNILTQEVVLTHTQPITIQLIQIGKIKKTCTITYTINGTMKKFESTTIRMCTIT